jgi:hypothetical protein
MTKGEFGFVSSKILAAVEAKMAFLGRGRGIRVRLVGLFFPRGFVFGASVVGCSLLVAGSAGLKKK